MLKKALLCLLCFSVFSSTLLADEEATAQGQNEHLYFPIEPDIITNYITSGKRIGFVRLSVELVVRSKGNLALLEAHEPLIRDKIITIFGEQNAKKVKSVTERDAIRQRCITDLNALLFAETTKKPIADLLFTKFLYQ